MIHKLGTIVRAILVHCFRVVSRAKGYWFRTIHSFRDVCVDNYMHSTIQFPFESMSRKWLVGTRSTESTAPV